ncbi:MAG: GLPGLI family protein [Bacteroidota bacterium]|nr:GLPGLI family protein [Bacteroidota bacterium]
MIKLICFLYCIVFCVTVTAQNIAFITNGRVEYERRLNQHKQLDDEEDNDWTRTMRKNFPKIVSDIYELRFTSNRSVYKLAQENTDNKYLWGSKPSDADVLVQNLNEHTISMQRDVFEQTYLLQDTSRKLDWHITNETRTIAGFECRKAVTKICDSVYVVAFYTDQIAVSSGPESFSGLPGLILGLAVPRLYTTWFATKVELIEPTTVQLNPKQKGKKTTWEKLHTDLNKALSDWGKFGTKFLWMFLL